MKKLLLMTLLVAAALQSMAQYRVQFQVNDSTGEGEAFATVRLYKASDTTKVVATGVTTLEGAFAHDIAQAGSYRVQVSAVGKLTAAKPFTVDASHKTADLGVIVLGASGNVLQGVTVMAAAPVVKNEIDRITYNVQNDDDSKTRNVLDMLRKVPLVTVDGKENILVKGSSSYKIYKNGHPDPSMSQNAKEVLKAIPASMIKRIEVITEPGAKYDAEGVTAILNIVTVDGATTRGVTGTVSAGISDRGNPNASAYITTQIGKVVASINYGYHHQTRHKDSQSNENLLHYTDSGNELLAKSNQLADVDVHYGNIDASYEPDTLNLLSLSFGGYYYTYDADASLQSVMSNAAGQTIYSYNRLDHTNGNNYFSFDGRFDFQHKTHRPDETLTLSYLLSTSHNKDNTINTYSDIEGTSFPYTGTTKDATENFLEQTAQFDWTRPFAKYHKLETGLKYINRSNKSHSIFDYTGYPEGDTNSRFNHLTQVAAAYMSYTFNKGDWSARAGLRYEFSHLSAKFPDGSQKNFHSNLSDWVPSASLQYRFNTQHSLKYSFSTSISRPGISYLNPAVTESPESKSYGNSELKSAHNYVNSLNYTYIGGKFMVIISPSLQIYTNGITNKQWTEGNVQYSTYINGLLMRWANVNGYVQYNNVNIGTTLMLNTGVGHMYYKVKSLDIRNDGLSFNMYASLTQRIPGDIRFSAYGGCFGGGPEGLYSESDRQWFYGLGLQRSFLKEDRLTVSLYANNPFTKNAKWTSRTVKGNYTGYSISRWYQREFSLRVSYRFGSLKASVKKATTTITNDDMVGGASAGGSNGRGK